MRGRHVGASLFAVALGTAVLPLSAGEPQFVSRPACSSDLKAPIERTARASQGLGNVTRAQAAKMTKASVEVASKATASSNETFCCLGGGWVPAPPGPPLPMPGTPFCMIDGAIKNRPLEGQAPMAYISACYDMADHAEGYARAVRDASGSPDDVKVAATELATSLDGLRHALDACRKTLPPPSTPAAPGPLPVPTPSVPPGKPPGMGCNTTAECQQGLECQAIATSRTGAKVCKLASVPVGGACDANRTCGAGLECRGGACRLPCACPLDCAAQSGAACARTVPTGRTVKVRTDCPRVHGVCPGPVCFTDGDGNCKKEVEQPETRTEACALVCP